MVKMFWTRDVQLSESTTNFYHCDEAYLGILTYLLYQLGIGEINK